MTRQSNQPEIEAWFVANTKLMNAIAKMIQLMKSNFKCSIADFWVMDVIPRINEITSNGNNTRKITRQPNILTMKPPIVGPTAGAIAIIKFAKPITVPVLEIGTCSTMMLNINGNAIPVPIP